MKKYSFLTFLLCLFIAFTGCNDWLEVEPSDKIDDSKLFSSYEGFRTSLNGIYQAISDGKLYGREMSWGTASVIGQDYRSGSTGTSSYYQYLHIHDYERSTVKSIQSNMWATAYNAIANCNKLIKEIENKDGSFFPFGIEEKKMIMGEALALRGFLHFDMARLFAPAPSTKDDGAYVPYHTDFPSYYVGKSKTSELLEKVIADLEKAKDLVITWDTLPDFYRYVYSLTYRFPSSYLYKPESEFFGSRGFRMNYVAICGMLARVYLYAGNYSKAKEYAQYIYDHFGPKGTPPWGSASSKWFKFTSSTYFGATSASLNYVKQYDDIIFALYDPNLLENIRTYKGTSTYMRINMTAFDFAGWDNGDDWRKKLIITDPKSASYYICQKWEDTGSTAAAVKLQYNLIPILRLSEIYYILSECLYQEGDEAGAINILFEVASSRGAKRKMDAAKFYDELLWEYRKDFMTEGQTFFAYKRLNKNFVIGTQTIDMSKKWVFPLPDKEEIF